MSGFSGSLVAALCPSDGDAGCADGSSVEAAGAVDGALAAGAVAAGWGALEAVAGASSPTAALLTPKPIASSSPKHAAVQIPRPNLPVDVCRTVTETLPVERD